MKRTVCIHIPRTAGDSLKRRARWLAPSFVYVGLKFKPVPFETDFLHLGHRSPAPLIARGVFTREWFDSCFKFTFVRNPWDRMVSLFEWYRKRLIVRAGRGNYHLSETNYLLQDFSTFVREVTGGSKWVWPPGFSFFPPYFDHASPQTEWLKWGIDFIGRFENLDADWERLCGIIGIDHSPLKRLNFTDHKPYPEYYNRDLRRRVADFYAEEIERFQYTF